jgi:hypothetical protein
MNFEGAPACPGANGGSSSSSLEIGARMVQLSGCLATHAWLASLRRPTFKFNKDRCAELTGLRVRLVRLGA